MSSLPRYRPTPKPTRVLSDVQTKVLSKAFSLFDEHNTGTIAIKELSNVLRSLGMRVAKEELNVIVTEVDPKKNGTLSLADFLKLVVQRMTDEETEDPEKEQREVFEAIDKDKNGYISSMNVREVLASLGEKISDEDVVGMLAEFDINKSGRVDYKEFSEMMKRVHQASPWP